MSIRECVNPYAPYLRIQGFLRNRCKTLRGGETLCMCDNKSLCNRAPKRKEVSITVMIILLFLCGTVALSYTFLIFLRNLEKARRTDCVLFVFLKWKNSFSNFFM